MICSIPLVRLLLAARLNDTHCFQNLIGEKYFHSYIFKLLITNFSIELSV